MFCILGPEMGLGDPQLAGRSLRSRFSSNKLKESMQAIPQKPSQLAHKTLGSIFSLNYDSVKSSVRRATSVRVTKRERKMTRAQDIFPSHPTSVQKWPKTPSFKSLRTEEPTSSAVPVRSRRPVSALSLDKPLPALPDERNEVQNDVLVQDFEGYLDILSYLQRGLPSRPKTQQQQQPVPGRQSTTAPNQTVISPAPKEDEWMSNRPVSQTSSLQTFSACSDELRRLRSRPPSGAATRPTSISGNTVTPKSSRESEWGVRGQKSALSGLGFASRIEEVSEPGTVSPVLTPDRRSTAVPHFCYHCGRDPTGKDVKDASGSPTTIIDIPRSNKLTESEPSKGHGPRITAEDSLGQKYILHPDTSSFEVLEKENQIGSNVPKTPENGAVSDFSSPLVRPSNPDPYATTYSSPDELPKQRQRAEIEFEDGVKVYKNLENTPPSMLRAESSLLKRLSGQDPYMSSISISPSHGLEQNETAGKEDFGKENLPDTSFWKNPEGVILVYQGVEVGGKELFYGSDINYLGSFYDDDEGSSGLGSTRESSHDLVGTGSGLAMIPEGGSSDDLWDDEAFEAR